ncbi:hypothetical protein [Persephonella sp. KM09-Lau-8]|uniref:hypothetical protein n=1 Tax=Persephonella sp. KM09-Lau-8 TaxID=1158345 RepID=UPI000496E2A1|nr:hypothetical protein [Persephonella sp. KM09-Lau-8]
MSHTATYEAILSDREALIKALQKLGLSYHEGVAKLFQTTEKGIVVNLPGWRYPIVIRKDGTVAYDNYNGRWGNIEKLHELNVTYALEQAKTNALKRGYRVKEHQVNGKTRLEMIKINSGGR